MNPYDWQEIAVVVVTHPMEDARLTVMKEEEAYRQLLELFNRNIDKCFRYEVEFNEHRENTQRTTYTLRFRALRPCYAN